TVPGPPVSQQSRNKARLAAWRALVRQEAARLWLTRPALAVPLRMSVTYYHEGPAARFDNDNMVKPIQDALNKLVYEDDHWITDTVVRKTSIDGLFRVRNASPAFLAAMASGDVFVHVVVDVAPSHAKPLT